MNTLNSSSSTSAPPLSFSRSFSPNPLGLLPVHIIPHFELQARGARETFTHVRLYDYVLANITATYQRVRSYLPPHTPPRLTTPRTTSLSISCMLLCICRILPLPVATTTTRIPFPFPLPRPWRYGSSFGSIILRFCAIVYQYCSLWPPPPLMLMNAYIYTGKICRVVGKLG